MDAFEAIHTRRSIRLFEEKHVDDELVDRIIRAAMTAPSAGNEQPWHFLIIRDKEKLAQIPIFYEYADMVPHADLAIVVCADPKLERHKGYWVQDCSAATQNLLLAVRALELGAVWCGIYPRTKKMTIARKLFSIPKNITPFALVPIGHPAQRSGKVDRYRKDRVHLEKW